MEVPYKGRTIVPRSERQPDSRWLPVAEIEDSYRGLVTSRPPVQAASRETRATRAEADAAAVKMAKAWIDAVEREDATGGATSPTTSHDQVRSIPSPPAAVPAARDAGPAGGSRRPRARDASDDEAARVREADKKGPTPKAELAGLYQAIGLDSDERVDRFTGALVVHFLLDRLVTAALVPKLADAREGTLDRIVDLPFATRIDLASLLGLITPGTARSIVELDRLQSRLVQLAPRDMIDASQSVSQDACDNALRKGIEAVRELMSARSLHG